MNLFKVSNTVYRGSRPETISDGLTLEAAGIKSILSLDGENGLLVPNETLNWGQVLPPSVADLTMALAVMDVLPSPVFVHCRAGVDRTGMLIAWYRIKRQEWSVDSAIKEMWQMGLHPWFFFWPWFLRMYCK